MGKTILKNVHVEVDNHDLSNRSSQVAVNTSADDVDLTCFMSEFKEHGQGMKDAEFTVTFFQDFDTGSVDDVLWALSLAGESFPITIQDLDGGGDAFHMDAVMLAYNGLNGSVGEASKTDVTFVNAAQAGVTRPAS